MALCPAFPMGVALNHTALLHHMALQQLSQQCPPDGAKQHQAGRSPATRLVSESEVAAFLNRLVSCFLQHNKDQSSVFVSQFHEAHSGVVLWQVLSFAPFAALCVPEFSSAEKELQRTLTVLQLPGGQACGGGAQCALARALTNILPWCGDAAKAEPVLERLAASVTQAMQDSVSQQLAVSHSISAGGVVGEWVRNHWIAPDTMKHAAFCFAPPPPHLLVIFTAAQLFSLVCCCVLFLSPSLAFLVSMTPPSSPFSLPFSWPLWT